ncbi:MAG: hypothetical protein HQK49_09085 [Oligoflexia bacterium]|nr:hypothetical protein [Oligoflexia bacterium]
MSPKILIPETKWTYWHFHYPKFLKDLNFIEKIRSFIKSFLSKVKNAFSDEHLIQTQDKDLLNELRQLHFQHQQGGVFLHNSRNPYGNFYV